MKKILTIFISSLCIHTIYCASDEEKTLFPAEISSCVSSAYKERMQNFFTKLQEPRHRAGGFMSRDASQAYMAFLNYGPRNVMHQFPELVKRADTLQQDILADTTSAVSLLMLGASKSKKDSTFWECLHASLRITLKDMVKGVTICPTDLETMEHNNITTENPEDGWSTERQPDFVGALIVMIRMMEFNHQQDPEAFKMLFQKSHC